MVASVSYLFPDPRLEAAAKLMHEQSEKARAAAITGHKPRAWDDLDRTNKDARLNRLRTVVDTYHGPRAQDFSLVRWGVDWYVIPLTMTKDWETWKRTHPALGNVPTFARRVDIENLVFRDPGVLP